MIFSFKKGQKVPDWVQHCSGGNSSQNDFEIEFGCAGKLFVSESGSLVIWPQKPRDKRKSIIFIGHGENLKLNGAGDNNKVCYFSTSAKKARQEFRFKNSAAAKQLPESDPRVQLGYV